MFWLQVVDLLLQHGARPNITEQEEGVCPLHAACQYGDLNIVNALLAAGAIVNLQVRHISDRSQITSSHSGGVGE